MAEENGGDVLRGVNATADITPLERVMDIPRHLLITVEDGMQTR